MQREPVPPRTMLKMRTIVAALDLSTASNAVMARAIQLATAHAARLTLVHAITAESLPDMASISVQGESRLRGQLAKQAYASIEKGLVESNRTRRSDTRIDFGSPHEVIIRIAHEVSADLIVIGPHARRSAMAKILGSTADRVLRTSPIPVLIVKRRSSKPYRNVAVAVDFSPQSEAAAKAALKLAPDATVQLVHVVDIPLPFEQAMRRIGTPSAQIEEYRQTRASRARHDLSVFATDVIGRRETVGRELEGAPGAALVRLSRSKDIDLLALGSHGRGVVLQALLGSVALQILREAACDVLVARSS